MAKKYVCKSLPSINVDVLRYSLLLGLSCIIIIHLTACSSGLSSQDSSVESLPRLNISAQTINQGDRFSYTINEAQDLSYVNLKEDYTIDIIDSDETGLIYNSTSNTFSSEATSSLSPGTYIIIGTISDSDENESFWTFSLAITKTDNTAPTLNMTSQTITQGQSFFLTINETQDIADLRENEAYTITIDQDNGSGMIYAPLSKTFVGTTALLSPGNYNIEGHITDGDGNSSDWSFNLEIIAIQPGDQTAPSLSIAPQIIEKGSNFSYNIDENKDISHLRSGEPYTIFISDDGGSNVSYHSGNSKVFSGSTGSLDVGTYVIIGIISDGNNNSSTWVFILQVLKADQTAPTLNISDQMINEGIDFSYTLNESQDIADRENGESYTITVTHHNGTGITYNSASKIFSGITSSLKPGIYTVIGAITDGNDNVSIWAFNLTVQGDGDLPPFLSISTQEVNQGETFSYTINETNDITNLNSGEAYTITIVNSAGANVTYDSSLKAFSAETSLVIPGMYTVVGTITDSDAYQSSWFFILNVNELESVDPIDPIEPVVGSGCTDENFRGAGTFSDPFIVCSATLLNKIRESISTGIVFYELEQDIDLGGDVFEPLGAAGAECSETGAFSYYFVGNGKRIVNYRVPMSRQDYYHPTDRRQDIFGRCLSSVIDLTVNPGSPNQEIEFCDLFDYGSNGGGLGLSLAEEQADGSFTLGPRILCYLNQLNAMSGDVNNFDKDYILYKDMDFENVEYSSSIINGDYNGTFDGNHKTIRNLNINSSDLHVGFFKRIQQSSIVKDLKFENVSIKSTNGSGINGGDNTTKNYNPSRIGVLAGEVREGHVVNCSVTDSDADVDVLFENSSSSGVVVGGLIGYGLGLSLEDSSSQDLHIKVISSTTTQKLDVGGLVGHQGPCLHHTTNSLDCSIGSTSNTVGNIKRSYTAYQNIDLNLTVNNYSTSVGGLIGRMGFDDNNIFQITDSYSWENSLVSSGSSDVSFGGLVGEWSRIFFGSGSKAAEIYGGNLTIINSYAFGGNVFVQKGRLGGLFGYQNTKSTNDEDSLTIKNSFSNVPFTNFAERSSNSSAAERSHIGGLYGDGGYSWNAVRNFSEAYYIGQIYCGPGIRLDNCGGIGGAAIPSGGTFDASIFSMRNIYSTAEIQQASGSSGRIDHIGLLFSGVSAFFQSSAPSGKPVFSAFGVAANVEDNPPLYFRRNGITVREGILPGDTQSSYSTLKSPDQPCIALRGNNGGNACLGLAVDPEDSMTAGNRSLTPTQFQSVPSNSIVATGTSPSLGDEFLYADGWCPRVCRDGESSCTETSNTLVGFDENGNPLSGPGGGLAAQARNEGRNCFEPCFEYEGNTIRSYRCKSLTVRIPEDTTIIFAEAFKDQDLTSVEFPESITSIGNEAFSGNELVDIIIPASVTSIGDNAFSDNSTLTSVCIEAQEANVALGNTPFGDLTSSSITYETDGDCSN